MEFAICAAFALIAVEASSAEFYSQKKYPEVTVFKPKERSYGMEIKELHECISCNDDSNAREDYMKCLSDIPEKYKSMLNRCCKENFDEYTCEESIKEKMDFKAVCKNPKKAISAGKCFWSKVGKNVEDLRDYKICKSRIMKKYCTSSEGFD